MMVKRGRPGIKPYIKSLIVSKVLEDRAKPQKEWMPRKALAFELQREIERMGELAPEQSTLEKRISDYSKTIKNPAPQDKPWSIATLDSYPVPSETLPVVLKAYKRHIDEGTDFTIRQAKWVSRLSATEWSETSIPDLIARTEQLYEIIHRPFDFEVYDKLLAGLKAEANDLIPLFASASLAGILKNDPTKKGKEAHNER